MAAALRSPARGSPTGLYGKLPARADFVTIGLPRSFVEPWDAWLQTAITTSRDQLGGRWLDCYLTAPVWRFALAPGVSGPLAAAGVLIPSVDAVNRHFPLTLAVLMSSAHPPLRTACQNGQWFTDIEACALSCLDPALDLDELRGRLDALAWPAESATSDVDAAAIRSIRECPDGSWFSVSAAMVEPGLAPSSCVPLLDAMLGSRYVPLGLWWTAGSDRVTPAVAVTNGLPASGMFRSFLLDPDPRPRVEPPVESCAEPGSIRP